MPPLLLFLFFMSVPNIISVRVLYPCRCVSKLVGCRSLRVIDGNGDVTDPSLHVYLDSGDIPVVIYRIHALTLEALICVCGQL
ncbi:hypothetical protein BDR07DRAFT_1428186 [Suillus spraguei]|nr:hypothetical protein BDR07DRAFT_1428186 [Suillus spraguei]